MISHSPLTQQSPVTVQDKNTFYFDSKQHDIKTTTNVNEKNLEALFPPSGNISKLIRFYLIDSQKYRCLYIYFHRISRSV